MQHGDSLACPQQEPPRAQLEESSTCYTCPGFLAALVLGRQKGAGDESFFPNKHLPGLVHAWAQLAAQEKHFNDHSGLIHTVP